MKPLIRIMLLTAVLSAIFAQAAQAESIWDSARIGVLVSLEGEGGCASAELPAKLAVKQVGEVTLSWTLSAIGLYEDGSTLFPRRATLGTGLLAECDKWGSASISLTYTKQYNWSLNATPIRILF